MTSTMPQKIDVHSHFLPSFYRQACRDNGHGNPDGMPYLPEWTVEEHLSLMDKLGISKSFLSISSPGTHLVPGNNELARKLTRDCNAYAFDLKKQMPERLGYYASLPVPDVEGCLAEIARAEEQLCDGFTLLTNTHGHYLGDEELDPIFEELNNRNALVFIHPGTPMCPCSAQAEAAGQQPTKAAPFAGRYPQPLFEFFFDTARVVTNLFLSGTVKRYPNINFILPHLGGAFPPLLSRWTGYSQLVSGPWVGLPEAEVLEIFKRRFWFDMAGFAVSSQLRGLVHGTGIPPSRILYGTDYPFTRADGVEFLLGIMDKAVRELFTDEEIENLYHRNAEKMLRR